MGRCVSGPEICASGVCRCHGRVAEQNSITPLVEGGQSESEGREALREMVDDSSISAITLQMRQPKKVALEWEGL